MYNITSPLILHYKIKGIIMFHKQLKKKTRN